MSINVANLHPNWRSLGLGHIRQVRMTLRSGRHQIDCVRIIKQSQRELADIRAAVRAAQAPPPVSWSPRDISWIYEYGMAQKLSNPIRCF